MRKVQVIANGSGARVARHGRITSSSPGTRQGVSLVTSSRQRSIELVEYLLWEWGEWKRSTPAPPIPTVYETETAPSRHAHNSQVERYVMRHQRAVAVDAVVNRMPIILRRQAWWRYVQGLTVGRTIRQLRISRAEYYRRRRDILGRIADAIARGDVPY